MPHYRLRIKCLYMEKCLHRGVLFEFWTYCAIRYTDFNRDVLCLENYNLIFPLMGDYPPYLLCFNCDL